MARVIPCPTYRTDAYASGWAAFERGEHLAASRPSAADNFSHWYDFGAGWHDRAGIDVSPLVWDVIDTSAGEG